VTGPPGDTAAGREPGTDNGYGSGVETMSPPGAPSVESERTEADDAKPRRKWWPRLRVVVSAAMVGAAVYVLVGRASYVTKAWHLLGRLDWKWVGIAVLFEAASMVVFARMQQWLLRAGGVELPTRTMIEITVAGNAVAATLPGGVAWAGAWVFGQLSRRGVSRFLRIWMFLVAGAVSSFALFLVVAAGIELAGARGPVSGLRWAALGLAAIPVFGVALLAARHRPPVVRAGHRFAQALSDNGPGLWLLGRTKRLWARLQMVRLGWWGWAEVLGLALLNWLYDCAVLIVVLLALGIAVPWRGVFVIYGLTQIAAAIPITPGGIGVVEGTLGALLHAYGVPVEQTVAAVIVYRIVSFWGLVPIGWGLWVALDVLEQRGRRVGMAHPWAEHRHGVGANVQAAVARRRLLREPSVCTSQAQCGGDERADAPGREREAS